ncbi:MAG: hypothetical protein L3J28_13115 [Candidatus Polarisedimenticolaceae bacterium]|nr:hypothetical protein [Candidatus Polarisedimenticolaceae bacterium]
MAKINRQALLTVRVRCYGYFQTSIFQLTNESLQENKFERQQLSGKILLSISPPPVLALDGSVYAAARFWDYSVEELPWYWCKTFGKESVTGFLNDLLPDCAEEDLKRSIKTMLFWCKNGA